MSKIGKNMPLLSTLAALVIIVHSAEENFEPDYHEFRPRALDLAPANYEQAWQDTNVEQIQPDKNKAENWHDSHVNEPLRRRRLGRKRKRRPQLSSTEDFDPTETFSHQDGSMSFQEEEYNHNTDVPKRRRKKIDQHQENDPSQPTYNHRDESIEGPKRRRKGQRRKRPIVHSWPEVSEPDYPQHDQIKEQANINDENNLPYSNNDHEIIETDRMEVKIEDKHYTDKTEDSIEITNQSPFKNNKLDTVLPHVKHYESEIITENVEKSESPNLETDKSKRILEVSEQNRSKRLDPLTLKALLKKSNGRSLSEILQQNNLSLSDLLSGKEQAVSILNMEDSVQSQESERVIETPRKQIFSLDKTSSEEFINKSNNNIIINKEKQLKPIIEDTTTEAKYFKEKNEDNTEEKEINDKSNVNTNLNSDGISSSVNMRRRYPTVRRKLRMRPVLSNSYKAQLSRDLITLSSIKYQNNRNSTRFRNFKDLMTSKLDRTEPSIMDTTEAETVTATFIPDEMVTTVDDQINDLTTITLLKDNNVVSENDEIETLKTADSNSPVVSQTECDDKETTTLVFELEPEFIFTTTTESPKEMYPIKPASTRRQIFDNRLKRKRTKQRIFTGAPEDYEMKDVFNMANLVPASEFIAKTKTTAADDETDFTTLEDFLTTEPSFDTRRRNKSRKRNFNRNFGVSTTQKPISTTEVTAKIEIQEILNDTSTSERLSRILKERNMTLLELVEQRERGSSHVHLADIFHNASKEPNPPEPFLSKSLIEPISKETYPLRALLEANQYDPKVTTIDSITGQSNYLNKPIVLDFGNNVNENSENMGIISLFQNFTKNHLSKKETKNENANNTNEIIQISNTSNIQGREAREGRALEPDKALISWNEIINFMQNKEQNGTVTETTSIEYENPTTETANKLKTNEDSIDERLGFFEDLQYLTNHLDRQSIPLPKSDHNLNVYEENDNVEVLDTVDSSYMSTTKSVTVATACIIGLSLVLFLLTYTILKWKQDAKILRNNSCRKTDEIPTPVFENRKGQRINSSTRSKSPMLSNSNIYAIDSLDTHKGNDSPEYMWDSLRKPFQ